MIDTHAHLADSRFDGDREEVLTRAREAGVRCVVNVGETLADGERNLELALEHPMLLSGAGLFPTHLDPVRAEAMTAFIRTHRERLTTVGEVGLDYRRVEDHDERDVQRAIFALFIDVAFELDLPLNVHSRSAGHYALDLLLERGARRVQMHAFSGRAVHALRGAEAGYYFSIPPSVIRSRQKQKLVRRLPLSALLLESDSPVLGPDPDARNEPANIAVSCETIAQIKGISFEEVAEATSENALRLYGPLPTGDAI